MSQELPPLELKKVLSPKQLDLLRLCRYKTEAKKIIGVYGTRKSGKTVGALHCIVDHLWRINGAEFLIIVRAQGDGTTGGVWSQIVNDILPVWMGKSINGEEMAWAEGGQPKPNVSKKMILKVTNMHGTTSTLMMDSLDNEEEVEKYKSRSFTGLYWSEAGEFKADMSFSTFYMTLRGIDRAQDDFLFLIDANPPAEGEDHFLFKRFYERRLASDLNDHEKALNRCLHVTEWTMADNPFLSQQEIDETKGLYANDPELYDRFVRGMWRRATRELLFADIFKKAIHVYGSTDDGMLLLPTETCYELNTSHDAGGVNPVSYFVERTLFQQKYKDRDGVEKTRDTYYFQYLDELAFVGKQTLVGDFVSRELELMDFWEHELDRVPKWSHFADNSALNFKESIVNRTVADEMYAQSGGRIELIGVEKGKGSIEHRVRLWRKLLMENRIIIGGLRCPNLVEMNEKIKRGVTEGSIQKGTPYKHYFDAATYLLVNLLWEELQAMTRGIRLNARKSKMGSPLVSVRL